MNDFLDYALPGLLCVIGVALTALDSGPSLLNALGLLCVAGGGFWLGATVARTACE